MVFKRSSVFLNFLIDMDSKSYLECKEVIPQG